jgi:hypothetical protein
LRNQRRQAIYGQSDLVHDELREERRHRLSDGSSPSDHKKRLWQAVRRDAKGVTLLKYCPIIVSSGKKRNVCDEIDHPDRNMKNNRIQKQYTSMQATAATSQPK